MKKCVAFTSIIIVGLSALAQVSFAASNNNVTIGLNHAYPKTDGTYAVVVKDVPGVHLAMYVNDTNPVYATVNKTDWATFRGVKLPKSTGKISFGRIFNTNGKSYQMPLRYVRFFNATDVNTVAFLVANPIKPAVVAAPTVKTISKPVVTHVSTPAPVPTPQPTCTNGTYVNSVGNTVCSPETAPSAPAGATAQCVDGTYSFSQSHSGTCSHHGGVAAWL